jgi:hypothetical protein
MPSRLESSNDSVPDHHQGHQLNESSYIHNGSRLRRSCGKTGRIGPFEFEPKPWAGAIRRQGAIHRPRRAVKEHPLDSRMIEKIFPYPE